MYRFLIIYFYIRLHSLGAVRGRLRLKRSLRGTAQTLARGHCKRGRGSITFNPRRVHVLESFAETPIFSFTFSEARC